MVSYARTWLFSFIGLGGAFCAVLLQADVYRYGKYTKNILKTADRLNPHSEDILLFIPMSHTTFVLKQRSAHIYEKMVSYICFLTIGYSLSNR